MRRSGRVDVPLATSSALSSELRDHLAVEPPVDFPAIHDRSFAALARREHATEELPQRPAVVHRAEDLPFWEFDYDLCQREGLSIIGDPDYVVREIRAQEQALGCGVIMGLFQFGSLPHDLSHALDALEADDVMRGALGDHIFTEYVRLKREEWAAYNEQVHQWEIDEYMDRY